ncbi:MAG TPA: sigma-70 family RNA polymerase sigma factor [Candidatus Paceibacterota bacterium]|nr:sigma-70 family RNA polymerase sigma factor [Phycisphaerae bacterium]HRZ45983.1 sigma-70 family RNA polymerase sigma factor [Candidatus Paceibacterota bacterium]HRZ45987.1 sigma-70 family RNA polymerase sigma factor [Candidatus Paceibacterota bacterium]HRZ57390.1 sigma-70 family RNA polymerase sigma factor [Candidatus Paceibacterota bacterium]
MSDVTRILAAIQDGHARAAEELLPLVYEELRQLAAHKLAQERPGQTLQATALVHEAWLRLVREEDRKWHDSKHFFCAAATAMRRILIDNARRKKSPKHGGGLDRVSLDDVVAPVPVRSEELLALDEALEKLAAEDPDAARLVDLRCFAGLGHQEAAQIMGLTRREADGLWAYARAWLFEALRKDAGANRHPLSPG